jgi:hypothetical protein
MPSDLDQRSQELALEQGLNDVGQAVGYRQQLSGDRNQPAIVQEQVDHDE